MLEKVLKYVFDVFMIYAILWMVFSLCEVFVPMWVITFFSLIVAGIINEDLDGDSNDDIPKTGGDIQNNLSL
jgi:hypothetical protein